MKKIIWVSLIALSFSSAYCKQENFMATKTANPVRSESVPLTSKNSLSHTLSESNSVQKAGKAAVVGEVLKTSLVQLTRLISKGAVYSACYLFFLKNLDFFQTKTSRVFVASPVVLGSLGLADYLTKKIDFLLSSGQDSSQKSKIDESEEFINFLIQLSEIPSSQTQ